MTPEMAAGLQAWMEQPGNIAELARWLEARDLNGFDAYLPPMTETKAIMQQLARSDMEEAFEAVRRRIGPLRLFTGEMIRSAVLLELADVTSTEVVRQWVTRRIRAEATQIQEFKMPPLQGRHKILGWRGVDHSWVADTTRGQEAVHQTALLLSKSVTSDRPVTGHGDSG